MVLELYSPCFKLELPFNGLHVVRLPPNISVLFNLSTLYPSLCPSFSFGISWFPKNVLHSYGMYNSLHLSFVYSLRLLHVQLELHVFPFKSTYYIHTIRMTTIVVFAVYTRLIVICLLLTLSSSSLSQYFSFFSVSHDTET